MFHAQADGSDGMTAMTRGDGTPSALAIMDGTKDEAAPIQAKSNKMILARLEDPTEVLNCRH